MEVSAGLCLGGCVVVALGPTLVPQTSTPRIVVYLAVSLLSIAINSLPLYFPDLPSVVCTSKLESVGERELMDCMFMQVLIPIPSIWQGCIVEYRQDNVGQVLAFPFRFSAHLMPLSAH